jgi:hypothetical protein
MRIWPPVRTQNRAPFEVSTDPASTHLGETAQTVTAAMMQTAPMTSHLKARHDSFAPSSLVDVPSAYLPALPNSVPLVAASDLDR